jgi:hypothetical protein
VGNDYTIRFHNRLYQVHKPALPGLRQGRVVMEGRLDGSLAIRFREHYLKYTDLGVVPPKSRSLSRGSQLNDGVEDRVSAEPRPPDATPTGDCSAGNWAGSDPSPSTTADGPRVPYRPPATHPWRRKLLGPTPTS